MQGFWKRVTGLTSAAAVLILAACGGEGEPTAVPATPTVAFESAAVFVVPTVAPTEILVAEATGMPTATAQPMALRGDSDWQAL